MDRFVDEALVLGTVDYGDADRLVDPEAGQATADPATGHAPQPVLVLDMERGRIVGPSDLRSTPAWAKPIVAAALELTQGP